MIDDRMAKLRVLMERLASDGWPKTAACEYASLRLRVGRQTAERFAEGLDFEPVNCGRRIEFAGGDTVLEVMERHRVGTKTAERLLSPPADRSLLPVEATVRESKPVRLSWPAPPVRYWSDRIEAACQPDGRRVAEWA